MQKYYIIKITLNSFLFMEKQRRNLTLGVLSHSVNVERHSILHSIYEDYRALIALTCNPAKGLTNGYIGCPFAVIPLPFPHIAF